MNVKNKISDCPDSLKKYIKQANYLIADSWQFMHPKKVDSDFSPNERRKIFNELAEMLSSECFEDYPWINKVINRKTQTLDISLIDGVDIRKPLSLLEQITWEVSEELKRGEWVEAGIEPKRAFLVRPYPDLWSIIQKSANRRQTFLDFIKWNSHSSIRKEEVGISVREGVTAIKIINGVILPYSPEPVFDYVVTEKIDTRRIAKCPICQKIIWKKQMNAETCGEEKCAQRNKYLKKKNGDLGAQVVSERRQTERRNWLNADFRQIPNSL